MTKKQESTQSTQTERLLPSIDVLKLGKRIVEELGPDKAYDTLSKWVANLIAEKMVAIETAADESEKLRLQQQTVDLILRIWKERYCVPPCIRPFNRIEKAIGYIAARKDRETDPILAFRSNREDKNAIGRLRDAFDSMHYSAIHLLALTPLVLEAGDNPVAWEDANRDLLEEDEVHLVDVVKGWLSLLKDTKDWEKDWSDLTEMSASQRVTRVVARLESHLEGLRQAIDEFKREAINDSDDSD